MERRTRHEELYEALKEQLIAMTPGTPFFSVRNIMTEHGVSQQTATQALEQLFKEKLLIRNDRRRHIVTEQAMLYRPGALPVIGLTVSDFQSNLNNHEIQLFQQAAERHRFRPLMLSYSWRKGILTERPAFKVDALLVATSVLFMEKEHTETLNRFQLPFVLLDVPANDRRIHQVLRDDQHSGRIAARHLMELGHRSIAFLISEPYHVQMEQRKKGVSDFCREHGLQLTIVNANITHGDNSVDATYEAMKRELAHPVDYTGIIVFSEDPALGVYRAINEAGYRIPHDFSVVGGDNLGLGRHFSPPLTTLSNELQTRIERALDILLSQLAGKPQSPGRHMIENRLILRESTAPAPISSHRQALIPNK